MKENFYTTNENFEEQRKGFEECKAEVSEFLKKEKIGKNSKKALKENTGTIDEGAQELIEGLNQLPFLYTTGSCGGHIISKESLLKKYNGKLPKGTRVPPEGDGVYISGFIHFKIKNSAKSKKFVEKLFDIVKHFKDAQFDEPNLHGSPGSIMFSKITGRKPIDLALAKELEAEREKLKSEIVKLAKEFL